MSLHVVTRFDQSRCSVLHEHLQYCRVSYRTASAECERLTAAADAGAALRRALDAQLQQANAQALKQEESIKVLHSSAP